MSDEAKVDLTRVSLLLDIATRSAPAVFPNLGNVHAAAVQELMDIDAAMAKAALAAKAKAAEEAAAKAAEGTPTAEAA